MGMSTLGVTSTEKRKKCMLRRKRSSPKTRSLGQLLEVEMNRNETVQLSILDDVPCLAPRPWVSFSMLEMSEALKACSNVSAPGPDHITWQAH